MNNTSDFYYGCAAEANAPDPACAADPFVLSCFQAYKTTLEPWHYDQLARIAIEIVKRGIEGRPVGSVLVIGHAADWRPSDDTIGLGMGRANAVMAGLRSLLAKHGPALARPLLIPLSLGDVEPAASNATQAGRRLNRRVTVQLLQAGRPTRRKKGTCRRSSKDEVRSLAFQLLGRKPHDFDVLSELWLAIKRADTALCRDLGRKFRRLRRQHPLQWPRYAAIAARLACIFAHVTYIQPLQTTFADQPERQLAYLRGMAYGVMDLATSTARSLGRLPALTSQGGAFEEGYRLIQARILLLRDNPDVRPKIDAVLAGIACYKQLHVPTTIIYRAFLEVAVSELRSGIAYIKTSGYCALDYPQLRARSCGPTPY